MGVCACGVGAHVVAWGGGGPIFQNAQHLLNITLHIFEIHSLEILNPQKKSYCIYHKTMPTL